MPRLFPTLQGEAIGRFTSDGVDYATCLVSYLPGRVLAASPPGRALLENLGSTLARVDRALPGLGRRRSSAPQIFPNRLPRTIPPRRLDTLVRCA